MWYEILPGVIAMWVCLSIPGIAIARVNSYTNGGKQQRIARNHWQWSLLDRDRRVSGTGRFYESKGLENIK